ncbi:Hypothetical protein CINCED_3A019684 [Cinara cedri]|uniref:Adenylate kinase isoenzyme 5 n=1 Tax=Cinara cedri TaxID=506608 RepID=A0A5E4M1L9_9HEMI|nr:Hypothetical protein CINCED_3A019684 [Cinara cedri]
MGICLDTDRIPDEKNYKNGSKDRHSWDADDNNETYGNNGGTYSHEHGHVKFDTPKVPVIFVLGGPGSGKVTHCDNLMIEKRGIVHINMTDLLQQYTVGNDMEDFSKLSSVTVTEVLMLEIKMSPAAKTFLISGYPRNMRDVVEYTTKIKVVNGVILISWNQNVLERQIDYGAKLGHVVLSLARMELNNFYKNVTPVSDFYDQRSMLISVNGERNPTEVYNDFRSSVLQILSAHRTPVPVTVPNGNAVPVPPLKGDDVEHLDGSGVEHLDDDGVEHLDGDGVERPGDDGAERRPADRDAKRQRADRDTEPRPADRDAERRPADRGAKRRAGDMAAVHTPVSKTGDNESRPTKYPTVVCVVGGPGSNKSSLCQKVLMANTSWAHVSMGPILRSLASSQETLQAKISSGQIVEESIVHEILDAEMFKYKNAEGILMDGYPRTVGQLNYFEKKYAQRPKLILLDCSKLQLGRGRLDDSVSAFRRRLESFREQTLPMLKALDRDHRLTVVDGNTDEKNVQEKFMDTLKETMKGDNIPVYREDDAVLPHGPERTVEQAVIARPAVPRQNGFIPNSANDNNRVPHLRYNVRDMYAQIGPNDSVL